MGTAAGLGAVTALLAVPCAVPAAHARGRHRSRPPGRRHGRAAHVLRATDRARLRYISAKGATLYEVGRATGALPGAMRVHMRVEADFSGSFEIRTAGGTISGHGRATPKGRGTIESFHGTLVVTGGSGRYRHARGRAGLYGTFNRNSYALTIKTTGTLHY